MFLSVSLFVVFFLVFVVSIVCQCVVFIICQCVGSCCQIVGFVSQFLLWLLDCIYDRVFVLIVSLIVDLFLCLYVCRVCFMYVSMYVSLVLYVSFMIVLLYPCYDCQDVGCMIVSSRSPPR